MRLKMPIDSYQPLPNSGDPDRIKRQQPPADLTGTSSNLATDAAQISTEILTQRLAATPEIRQGRVDAVKQAMSAGTYSVTNDQLANAMWNEFFKK
jgi:flagellar biosynthesis anti-sigma factor FlgM